MRPSDALNHIVSRQLVEAFGKGLGARIIFAARDASGAPVVGLNNEAYAALVEAIAKDDRVRQMWGDFGSRSRLSEWKRLVE